MLKILFGSLQERGIPTKWIKRLCWILFGILLLSMGLFIYDFGGKSEFATDITLWGYFGDFWWNLVTALATSLNLIAFVIITIMVAKMSKAQSDSALKTETLLVITQIKMDCVMELQKNLSNIIAIGTERNTSKRKQNLSSIQAFLLSFKNAYLSVLFTDTGKSEIEQLIETTKTMKNKNSDIRSDIDNFIKQRDELLKALLNEIQQKVHNNETTNS
ncbi:MAG: hypothetical protein LBD21_04020 [Tannerellaceae bacterium]|jgi:hypothetical protein|nr:hypothetical protein [Tannerellaceae bacterium]